MTTTDDHTARVAIRVREVHDIVARVRASKYIPSHFEPTEKQWSFLCDPHFEVLFGGSTGPGKSVALLMDQIAYATEPGFNGLLLRRTFPELSGPDGLMAEARAWLGGTDAQATDGTKRWTFPAGGTISFGHMENDDDRFKYSSSQFSRVSYDELTTFTEPQYLFLFSRIRKPTRRSTIPLGMRSATNPIGRGLKWVRTRFVDGPDPNGLHDAALQHAIGADLDNPRAVRNFIAALAVDNPHLEQSSYELSMAMLDPITKARLRHGRWDISASGRFFDLENLGMVRFYEPGPSVVMVRAYDLAATEGGGDYTVGALVAFDRLSLRYTVVDLVRGQFGPAELETVMRRTADDDASRYGAVRIMLEQEPGSSGKIAARDIGRRVLAGHEVVSRPSTGAKAERARLPAALIDRGDVDAVVGPWFNDLKDELVAFAENPKESGEHDDIVDALSAACHEIRRMIGAQSTADTSAVDTFRRMSVVTSDAARSTGPPRQGIPGLSGPSSSPFGNMPFRR